MKLLNFARSLQFETALSEEVKCSCDISRSRYIRHYILDANYNVELIIVNSHERLSNYLIALLQLREKSCEKNQYIAFLNRKS